MVAKTGGGALTIAAVSRVLAEEMVARVRNAPNDFADVRALAASAGVTPRALDALLREHYHADAATTLRRERVAAGAGSDDDVRAVRSMPRAAYARLGRSRAFTLSLPDDFHPEVPLRWLGRDMESRTERVNGNSVAKALVLDGSPTVLTIELRDGLRGSGVAGLGRPFNPATARCRVDRPVSAGGMRAAHDAAIRMLGLVADPASFERRALRDPLVRRLVRRRRGLRVPLTSTVFEALVWTIAGQQVNLAFAYRLRRVVIELAGKSVDGFIAHPTAEAVARLDYTDLTRRQW
jgi:AraC family transcriptional regulator, regulatory protein of adaptative response / DNA-3-methyladenine glycosylase II